MKSIICFFVLALRTLWRWRIYERNADLAQAVNNAKKWKNGCHICNRCKLLWYLANAIRLKDPYRILEIYYILKDLGINVESREIDEYIGESMAWTLPEGRNDNTAASNLGANVISQWKAEKSSFSIVDAVAIYPSKLYWPTEIIKGSIRELKGDKDGAIEDYRRALRRMPGWLPEASLLNQKINELKKS